MAKSKKIKLSDSMKVSIIEKAIQNLNKYEFWGICAAMIQSHADMHDKDYGGQLLDENNLFVVFPELLDFKPEDKRRGQFWFPLTEEGKNYRIHVLDTVQVKIIKNQF